jgi:hypothetical protein
MPSKKKPATATGSSAKEELPEPATLKSGTSVTYIGGWSSFPTIESVSAVSAQVTAAHTSESGVVASLPRTSIFFLPTDATDAANAAAGSGDTAQQPITVEVVDQMNLEGISRQQYGRANRATKSWARPPLPTAGAEGAADTATPTATTATAEAAANEGQPPTESAPVEGNATRAAAAATTPQEPVNPYEDALHDTRYSQTVLIGATYAARDVVVCGSCSLEGLPPNIFVPPQLPAKPDLDAITLDDAGGPAVGNAAGGAAAAPKPSSAAKRGAKKGKAKLTPEQLEELERKKAAVEAEYLQQTEEAVQRAQEEANYLMTFAHPDRWANVVFRHITFAGPVVVRRAHVTFQNCCFTSAVQDRPQLVVSQYCRVKCIKCTFEAPVRCGIYALPSSQVTVRKCLFTGVMQAMLWAADVAGVGLQAGGTATDINADDVGAADVGVDDDAHNVDSADGTQLSGKGGGGFASPMVLGGEMKEAVQRALHQHGSAVGIQTDNAKLHAQSCVFVALGVGTYVCGSYTAYMLRRPVAAKSTQQLASDACDVVVEGNAFHHFASTAVLLDTTTRLVGLRRNFVEACAYYGLDCQGGSKSVLVRGNHFAADAVVRIRQGANVALLHNIFQSIPVNDNVHDNPCLQPVY